MTVGFASSLTGVSKESLAGAEESLDAVVGTTDADVLGDQLFAVADLLAANSALRRALTDSARSATSRGELVQRLLAGQVGDAAVATVIGLAKARWAQPADLTIAVEHLAVTCVLASAERAGVLDDVEDELFRLGRAVVGHPDLRDALSARTPGRARKEELVRTLVSGRVRPQTLALALQAVSSPRGGRPERVLDGFVAVAAARRNRHVAEVTSATPLTGAQQARLQQSLERIYGRQVKVNVQLDPTVVGGLRVRLAGEVLDGTMIARLDAARRRLAS